MSTSSAAPTPPQVPSAQPLQTARRMQGSGEGGIEKKPVIRTYVEHTTYSAQWLHPRSM